MLSSLKKISLLGKKFEETPGMKIPYSEDVEMIQDGLEFLGFKLPMWGVDGKFGPETKSAVEKFQQSVGLNVDGVMKPIDIQHLLAHLLIGKFTESKRSPIEGTMGKKGDFTYVDLNSSDGFRLYAEICQNFIDGRNPNAGVNGQMMAECAKRNFSKGYVPPELALAQLALEGGLSSNTNVRPRKTKNPFNVGNTDSGKNKFFSSVQEGVCAYYDLMTRKYLTSGKTPEDLLSNFVNDKGYRYASGNYEPKLRKIVSGASKMSEPLIAKYSRGSSSMV
jgi:peptidoglycan hydrolase-like protein with peptidoglycan-binding domain